MVFFLFAQVGLKYTTPWRFQKYPCGQPQADAPNPSSSRNEFPHPPGMPMSSYWPADRMSTTLWSLTRCRNFPEDLVMAGRFLWLLVITFILLALGESPSRAAEADLILHHGKIVTVDKKFTIHQALAIQGKDILRVGSNEEVLQTKGNQTQLLDLKGKMVLPGLIDSHVHPTGACLTEFD